MRRLTSQKMTENRELLAHPTPPVGVTIGQANGQFAQYSRHTHGKLRKVHPLREVRWSI